jgi:hypothetical protein
MEKKKGWEKDSKDDNKVLQRMSSSRKKVREFQVLFE